MTDPTADLVPIWTLSTRPADAPFSFESSMTPERLVELRSVLAALAEAPIATLEARPKPESLDTSLGMSFGSISPIAQELSSFARQIPTAAPNVARSSEVLYRMVVPAKVAAQFSGDTLNPMTSKAVAGGIHSAMTSNGVIRGQATFVPVTAGTATAGALTVAAPLILLSVAAGASVYAEQQRKAALEKITVLLEKLHHDRLDDERNRLDGCRNAIDKATAVLLDKGTISSSLGLSPAVHTIDTAIAAAERRVKGWRDAIDTLMLRTVGRRPSSDEDKLPGNGVELNEVRVELPHLAAAINGIDSPDSEFYAHLKMADLAIALKRRVIVLQAVEHAQRDEGNPFENFTATLKLDAQNLDQLIDDLDDVKLKLSSLQVDRSHGLRDFSFSSGAVDKLLQTSRRLRELGDQVSSPRGQADVAIEIVQKQDGSVIVLPPTASS